MQQYDGQCKLKQSWYSVVTMCAYTQYSINIVLCEKNSWLFLGYTWQAVREVRQKRAAATEYYAATTKEIF